MLVQGHSRLDNTVIMISSVHRQSGWWTANPLTYVKENIIIFSLFDEHTYDRDIHYRYQSASPSGMISKLVSKDSCQSHLINIITVLIFKMINEF